MWWNVGLYIIKKTTRQYLSVKTEGVVMMKIANK